MRTVRFGNGREADLPDDWHEAREMLTEATNGYFDRRGGNLSRMSTCGRVTHGLFGEQFLAADPTDALVFLMQRICEREGAGLTNRESGGEAP
jgi:hypothetical protein